MEHKHTHIAVTVTHLLLLFLALAQIGLDLQALLTYDLLLALALFASLPLVVVDVADGVAHRLQVLGRFAGALGNGGLVRRQLLVLQTTTRSAQYVLQTKYTDWQHRNSSVASRATTCTT